MMVKFIILWIITEAGWTKHSTHYTMWGCQQAANAFEERMIEETGHSEWWKCEKEK